MSEPGAPARASDVVRVRVLFAIRKRGGRRLILVPVGAAPAPDRPRVDNAMIKAIARGFRWRKLLETGVYGTIEEIAAAEKKHSSYVSRLLRLTLRARASMSRCTASTHAMPALKLCLCD